MSIAGKIWGKPTGQRLLFIHGKQDNCGVFDRLIPLLHGNIYVVAIDLPGHGFSSHFPRGLTIHFLNYIIAIVYVVKHFKWSHFSFVGHSLGAQLGVFFAAFFPEYIEKFVAIDHVGPVNNDDEPTKVTRYWLNQFLKVEALLTSGKPPVYTYEQALEKLTNRNSALTTEAAKIVLKRSLKNAGSGYNFCMDQRLKLNSAPYFTMQHLNDVYEHIQCSALYIFSSERYPLYQKTYYGVFSIMKQRPNFTIKVVPGNHDVHQNHPERISELINNFIFRQLSKL